MATVDDPIRNQWRALRDWIDAADPGGVRKRHAAASAGAALTAWLALRLLTGLLPATPPPALSLFAVNVIFVLALVIVTYEAFPFAQAQTALADHALHLTSINDQVAKLAFADEEAVAAPVTAALMQKVQANVHATLQATIAGLTTEIPAASSIADAAVADASGTDAESPVTSTPGSDTIGNHGGGLALLELQSAVQALAAALGPTSGALASARGAAPSGSLENASTP